MAELADAADSKSVDGNIVGVQVPPRALITFCTLRENVSHGAMFTFRVHIYSFTLVQTYCPSLINRTSYHLVILHFELQID